MEMVPLAKNADGVICVAGTRVTLETVVDAFECGSTPEEIVQQYPSLTLADTYQVIAFFLRHRAEVEAELKEACGLREAVRAENERRFPPDGIRARLLARRANRSTC